MLTLHAELHHTLVYVHFPTVPVKWLRNLKQALLPIKN